MGHTGADKLARILIMVGFALFYITSALRGHLAYYVHPRMTPTVLMTAAVMLIVAWQTLRGRSTAVRPFSPARYVLFLIPLAAAWLIPVESLAGSGALRASYQSAGGAVQTAVQPAPAPAPSAPISPAPISSEASAPAPVPAPAERAPSPEEAPLDTLLAMDPIVMDGQSYVRIMDAIGADLDRYVGRRIVTTGFVFRMEDFEADQFVTARMMMACCAADAMPVGFLGHSPSGASLADGQWVRVEGTLQEGLYQDQPIPMIAVDAVTDTPPQDEYVYP